MLRFERLRVYIFPTRPLNVRPLNVEAEPSFSFYKLEFSAIFEPPIECRQQAIADPWCEHIGIPLLVYEATDNVNGC